MTITEYIMNSKGSVKYCLIYNLWTFIAAAWCENDEKKFGNTFQSNAIFKHFLKLLDLYVLMQM
jgi:hypothetical protein